MELGALAKAPVPHLEHADAPVPAGESKGQGFKGGQVTGLRTGQAGCIGAAYVDLLLWQARARCFREGAGAQRWRAPQESARPLSEIL